MLKIEKDILPDRQAKLTVTVEPERLQKELQAAAKRISKKANIPGFRKGKAPYHIIQRYFGEDSIFEEALEPLGQSIYVEALKECELEPYAPGEINDMTKDPLVMTFMVPLAPEVKLGAYRDIRIPFTVQEITKKDVEQALEELQDQQATLEVVERPVEWDDVAILDVVGTSVSKGDKKGKAKSSESDAGEGEDEPIIDRQGVQVLIAKKATFPVPGFPEKIVGMLANEERSFDVTISARAKDVDEELRGNTYHFEVTCHQVQKRDIPSLDDEFAKSVGEYEDLADLRKKIRRELEVQAEEATRSQYLDKIFDQLTSSVAEVSFPPVMLEEQIDDVVKDFEQRLQRQGVALDDYLKLSNLTEESVRDDFREPAKKQLTHALLLGRLSEAEQLDVSDEEVEDEVQTQLLSFGAQATVAKQLFGSPEIRRTFARRRLVEKTLDRVILIARGEAPPLAPDAPDNGVSDHEVAESASESAPASDEVPTEAAAE